mmetsp:Transcript_12450/g.30655  ORF Transcript_12450/g.30655 Transcript_12450/m.30655 type:complete len:164 (+) Transcript_12450:168-659(+)|eukprot:CAMPEP_0114516030 /NCGR_PEP_ID=MMETSP0109-20121206/17096_1 /TAXON_ID=29199 /ORGANISM="Chlorarachnion reptans, Strain CCCM449" /LENGTH=163 /DNA_ID=CAMNT_0001696363 /DNA_START=184 /DNA_END=675 /DNA_ORIENTATION=-
MPRDQAIHKAANLGKDDDVLNLLEEGVDPNVKGAQNRAAIHRAVSKDYHEIVQVLIEHKADVEAKDNNGYTPLHWAGMFGALESAKCLLEANANLGAASSTGDTALHLAAEKGKPEFITWALSEGAESVQNKAGVTPYALARKAKQKECQKLLAGSGPCACFS